MLPPAIARGGISTAPIAAQHGGNARIVSVLRFQLLPGGGGKCKPQGHAESEANPEIARCHADRGAQDQSQRESTIDHRYVSPIYPHSLGSMDP